MAVCRCGTTTELGEVLEVGLLCGVRDVFALLDFALGADGPEVLQAIDAVCALNGTGKRSGILEVSLNEFNATARQLLRGVVVCLASQGAELPTFQKHVADHRSTLPASCSSNENDAVGIGHGRFSSGSLDARDSKWLANRILGLIGPEARLTDRWTIWYNRPTEALHSSISTLYLRTRII